MKEKKDQLIARIIIINFKVWTKKELLDLRMKSASRIKKVDRLTSSWVSRLSRINC